MKNLPTPGRFERPARSRLLATVVTVAGTLIAVFGLCVWGGVRFNSTGSLPIGLYRISSAVDANLAEFCPLGLFSRISVLRQYRTPGNCPDGASPLLKPIVARPGDVVVASKAGLRVNGVLLKNTAPRAEDSKGRSLPHYPFGTYRVNAGTVWVASSYNPLSFDSRYFGPISTAAIHHRLKPLFTI